MIDHAVPTISRQCAAFAVVLAGTSILVARPFVGGGEAERVALFAVAYVAIGLASLAVPVPSGRRHVPRIAALAVGAAAVALSTAVVGPVVPIAWGGAALPLSGLAAVCEEALFRRAAYGQLERFGAPAAVLVSALLFALVHLPAYGVSAFPVDLGAGLLLGWQRWASGTWTVPAATHTFANVVAVLR